MSGLTTTVDWEESVRQQTISQAKIRADIEAEKARLGDPYSPSPGAISISGQAGYNNNTLNPAGATGLAPGEFNPYAKPVPYTPAPAPIAPVTQKQVIPVPPTVSSLTLAPGTYLQQGTGNLATPNESVRAVQTQLGIKADGIFGPATKSAVMAFQQANGLKVDGIIGPLTLAALQKTGGGTSAPSAPVPPAPTPFDANQPTYTVKAGDKFSPYDASPINVPAGTVINKPTAGTTQTPQDPGTQIATMNTNANAEAEKLLAGLKENLGTKVDVSNSEKLLKSLTESLAGLNAPATTTPTPSSLTEQLAAKRATLGVDPLETQMNGIDAQIAKLDTEFSALSDTETNRQVSMLQINRRKTQEEINYNKAKNDLINQKNSIANTLNQKYAVINTFMQYASQDYNNAQENYNTKFNQAISMINLIKNVEETAKSDMEKAQDNAKANLKVITEALEGKNYSVLDPATQTFINKTEMEGGLPVGITKIIMDNSSGDIFQSIGSSYDAADGSRVTPVYYKNASTGAIRVSLITGLPRAKEKETVTESNKYVVKAGDTLNALAKKFNTTVQDLINSNVNIDENNLQVGQKLNISKPKKAGSSTDISDEEFLKLLNG